jgi:hypothetical protein
VGVAVGIGVAVAAGVAVAVALGRDVVVGGSDVGVGGAVVTVAWTVPSPGADVAGGNAGGEAEHATSRDRPRSSRQWANIGERE